jgi:hypothetical protein
VLPSSCSIGALCSLGPGAEAEVVAAGVEAAAGEGAVAVAATIDSASPFKKGSAVMKGAENICLGVNPAMLAPWSGFDARRMRTNTSA